MATSGSGNRPSNQKRKGSGNRKHSPAPIESQAAERARERVQQRGQRPGGNRPGPSRRPPRRNARRSAGTTWGIYGGIFVVLVVVIILLFSLLGGGSSAKSPKPVPVRPASASLSHELQHVPVSELEAAGDGGVTNGTPNISGFGPVGSGAPLVVANGKPVTKNGKPEIVYLGAEFCPYCAVTRWGLTIALSRFGTFKGLSTTASSPVDLYPNTYTLSYVHATYSSKYLAFDETEQETNVCDAGVEKDPTSTKWPYPAYVCKSSDTVLQKTPLAVQKIAALYDTSKYFTSSGANGIPFIVFGGKYVEDGPIMSPGILRGAKWGAIVDSLKAPTEGIGQQVLGTANRYTAIICKMTNEKPASVCNTSFMKGQEKAVGS